VAYKYRAKGISAVLRYGLSPDIIILIFGVMFFKEVMDASGSVAGLSRLFAETGVPLMPTLLILPFLAGILTGLAIGFVGATFPLLVSLAGNVDPWTVSLAFGAGFIGVMLSPVHVCLILTREYFEADMPRVYHRMLLPSVLVLTVACTQYLLFH
jgi:integral membrane protein (TIGR00529 family)